MKQSTHSEQDLMRSDSLLGGLIMSTAMPNLGEDWRPVPVWTRTGTVPKSLQSLKLLGHAVLSC